MDHYIADLAVLFLGAFVLAYLLEPLVIRSCRALGIVDVPGWRRVHVAPTPRAGGIVFLPCMALGLYVVHRWYPHLWDEGFLGLGCALLLITAIGLIDDVNEMRASIKLLAQFGAGVILYSSGYRLNDVSIPFTHTVIDLSGPDFLITVIGVAAIINAVNMLDGLDGLAAGSVFIMCGFLFINKVTRGDIASCAVLVLVGGATIGFLRYNFHPARVFMGDTGSMFLGLALAAEVFDAASQGVAVTTILLPLVILGIPIFDMCQTVFTRYRGSQSIFAADKNHLHHRLLTLGLSHREAVFFIYGLNIYMGIMALLYPRVEVAYRALYLIALALFLLLASFLVAMGHRRNGNGVGNNGADLAGAAETSAEGSGEGAAGSDGAA